MKFGGIAARFRVLIAASPPTCRILLRSLGGRCRLITVDPTEDIVSLAQRLEPDLLIIEFASPSTRGTLSLLRSDPRGKLPVLVIGPRRSKAFLDVLRHGADDFLLEPFRDTEVRARASALLRVRMRMFGEPVRMSFAGLLVDFGAMRAHAGGRQLRLTKTELLILGALLRREGRSASKPALIAEVWRANGATFKTLDMHVANLRAKLGPFSRSIQTVRGFGYRIAG